MKYTSRGFRFEMWKKDNDINISITCDRGGGGQITIDSTCCVPLMHAMREAVLHLAMWEPRPAAWEEPETTDV